MVKLILKFMQINRSTPRSTSEYYMYEYVVGFIRCGLGLIISLSHRNLQNHMKLPHSYRPCTTHDVAPPLSRPSSPLQDHAAPANHASSSHLHLPPPPPPARASMSADAPAPLPYRRDRPLLLPYVPPAAFPKKKSNSRTV